MSGSSSITDSIFETLGSESRRNTGDSTRQVAPMQASHVCKAQVSPLLAQNRPRPFVAEPVQATRVCTEHQIAWIPLTSQDFLPGLCKDSQLAPGVNNII